MFVKKYQSSEHECIVDRVNVYTKKKTKRIVQSTVTGEPGK